MSSPLPSYGREPMCVVLAFAAAVAGLWAKLQAGGFLTIILGPGYLAAAAITIAFGRFASRQTPDVFALSFATSVSFVVAMLLQWDFGDYGNATKGWLTVTALPAGGGNGSFDPGGPWHAFNPLVLNLLVFVPWLLFMVRGHKRVKLRLRSELRQTRANAAELRAGADFGPPRW